MINLRSLLCCIRQYNFYELSVHHVHGVTSTRELLCVLVHSEVTITKQSGNCRTDTLDTCDVTMVIQFYPIR